MKKVKKKVLASAYSTYHGRVRIPFVSPYAPVILGEGIYMDSGCPGHVIFGESENNSYNEKDSEESSMSRKRTFK